MYFETWLDNKRRNDENWLAELRRFNQRDLRYYLDLITLTCILLASKVNEQNAHQPSLGDIRKLIRNRNTDEEFIQTEKFLIVECLDWNLMVTTPYHFTDCI